MCIWKERLDSGLTQLRAAEIIEVKEGTLWNWEHGTEPELRYMPAIIKFLGYVPFECPEDLVGKLAYYKRINGLSYERLGALMWREPEQLNGKTDSTAEIEEMRERLRLLQKELQTTTSKIDKLIDLWNSEAINKAPLTERFNRLKEKKPD